MSVFDSIAKSFRVAGQLPLDDKTYFPTLSQMQDLGTANSKAYQYYKYMTVMCVENGTRYEWKEVLVDYTGGALLSNFTYGPDTVSNNIDYSDKIYNFVPVSVSAGASSSIAKPYIIFKVNPAGADYLEIGDVVTGHFSPTVFMTARYKGGPINQLSSWAIATDSNPQNWF